MMSLWPIAIAEFQSLRPEDTLGHSQSRSLFSLSTPRPPPVLQIYLLLETIDTFSLNFYLRRAPPVPQHGPVREQLGRITSLLEGPKNPSHVVHLDGKHLSAEPSCCSSTTPYINSLQRHLLIWLISLNVTFSRAIYIVSWIATLCLFIAE